MHYICDTIESLRPGVMNIADTCIVAGLGARSFESNGDNSASVTKLLVIDTLYVLFCTSVVLPYVDCLRVVVSCS